MVYPRGPDTFIAVHFRHILKSKPIPPKTLIFSKSDTFGYAIRRFSKLLFKAVHLLHISGDP